jgi:cytochrome c553
LNKAAAVASLSILLATPGLLQANNNRAIAKAAVCAACHGANGASVADHVPNLAAQRESYLALQLRAFRSGDRKHDVMNPIAAQLSDEDISALASHFAAMPAATGSSKSTALPTMTATRVAVPQDFPQGFTPYWRQAGARSITTFFANDKALAAARAGQSLPNGSVIVGEIRAMMKGDDGKSVTGAVLSYSAMAREADWGNDVPAMLRNEGWNYGQFGASRQLRAGVNYAECFACHKAREQTSFIFTLQDLKNPHPAL